MDIANTRASPEAPSAPIDSRFQVGFVHRLRRTSGVFDDGNPVLAEIIRDEPGATGRVCAFIDSGVADAHPGVAGSVESYAGAWGFELAGPAVVVPGGERIKDGLGEVERVIREIDALRICRKSTVIIVGGGAVLDAVGLACALAHRGVRVVRVPTTTLSQCDSGVGVKCGVNMAGKKNLAGCFAPPAGVVNGTEFLATLEDRDWRSGFSEAVKVALIKDAAFFEQIEGAAAAIAVRDIPSAIPILDRSAEIHLRHITEGGDPFETESARPLDFGHWSAHRLETMSGYRLRHGEAVAIGIAIDALYSAEAGWLEAAECERILVLLERLGFELRAREIAERAGLLRGVDEFREHLGGRLALSFLGAIGVERRADRFDKEIADRAIARLEASP